MANTELAPHHVVQKAVEALLQLASASKKTESLFGDADAVQLQFCVKKIDSSQKTIKLKLPNGLNKNKEVCLFVKDLDKADRDYEKSVRHFKESLKAQGIDCVSQVIPLKALKLEYKPFEAKRKLSDSCDVFLADARIIRLLPAYLGKAFYGRKRLPIQVRMDSKDLKEEFEAAISNSRCLISGRGSASMATVGDTDMSVAELVQNIRASVDQMTAALPGGAINIRSMFIKTNASTSVPFYVSTGSANEVQLAETTQKKSATVVDEVTTVQNAMVKVYPSGVVKLIGPSGKTIKGKTVKRPVKALKRAGKRNPQKRKQKPKQVKRKKGGGAGKENKQKQVKGKKTEDTPTQTKQKPKQVKGKKTEGTPTETKQKPKQVKARKGKDSAVKVSSASGKVITAGGKSGKVQPAKRPTKPLKRAGKLKLNTKDTQQKPKQMKKKKVQ